MRKRTIDDKVNRPSHYTSGKIEVIDFIEDQKLGFCLGNAVKYIARAGKKAEEGMTIEEKEIQDLEKAQWYLNRRISVLKSAQDGGSDYQDNNTQPTDKTQGLYELKCIGCGNTFKSEHPLIELCPSCNSEYLSVIDTENN